jgi:glucosamine-phosphate N-acetyltransferase
MIIRKLNVNDYHSNYFNLLSQLTPTTVPSFDKFESFVENLNKNHTIIIILNEETQDIIASGTLWMEPKIIHQMGYVAHIEDIVVDASYRHQGLGQLLIQVLISIAKEKNCYKIILNCKKELIGFYEKCGFYTNGIEMRYECLTDK